MKSTTLVTFMLHHPTAHHVELMGSWDNFSEPWEMVRDNRRGRGHWTGCHTFRNIVCDGDASGIHEKRDGALKMGGTYWYYYRIDYYDEYYDPNQPSTSSCPFLPGQYLNVLEVPWEKRFISRSRSSSVSLVTDFDLSTLNPEDRYTTPRPAPRPKLPKLMTKLSKLDPPMFGPWSAAPPKTAESTMDLVREVQTSASAPEEIYKSLEAAYQLPGVGGRGRGIKIWSPLAARGLYSSSGSGSSTSYGPPALHLAIPGASRLRRSPSEAALSTMQFRDPFGQQQSAARPNVPWRSASTRSDMGYAPPTREWSAPHHSGTRQYVAYAPPPRRAATAPTTSGPHHRRMATAPSASSARAYAPSEYVPFDEYDDGSSDGAPAAPPTETHTHTHRRACSHESGLGLTLPPSLRIGHQPYSPTSPDVRAILPQYADTQYFPTREAALESIPQSPGLTWQVGRVGEDEDEEVVVVERGGEKLFVVNADEEASWDMQERGDELETRSKSAGASSVADSTLITMAMLSGKADVVARRHSTDSARRSESLYSVLLPPIPIDEAAAPGIKPRSDSGSTSSSTRPETAVRAPPRALPPPPPPPPPPPRDTVKRKPVGQPERINVNKDLPALPADLMPSPLFSSTAAVLSAMESDDYYGGADDAVANGAATGDATRSRPPRLTIPPPPAFRDGLDWGDLLHSRFSIWSPDPTAADSHHADLDPPQRRPPRIPKNYAESSDADDTDNASLTARSSDGDGDGDNDDARSSVSASTYSVGAPSGAASACASPPTAPAASPRDAAFSATVGGPVRKPSSRRLHAAAVGAGGKAKATSADAEAEAARAGQQGIAAARQAVAQMQLLLDEFEYLGGALT